MVRMGPVYDATRHFQVRQQENSDSEGDIGCAVPLSSVLEFFSEAARVSRLLLHAGNGSVPGRIDQKRSNSFIDEQKVPM